jgi:glycosyltransferase involved in cell wall biosynthesis
VKGERLAPNILFIDYTGELAGGQLCLADIAIQLRDRCHVFLFESGPFQDLLAKNGVSVQVPRARMASLSVRKKSGLSAYAASVPVLVSLMFSLAGVARRFDLLYANTAKALMVAAPVALLLRKPLLVHLHDIIGAEHFNRINSWLLVMGANLATGIVANSEATAAAYRKAGGKNRNLKVIRNGFATERFDADVNELSRTLRKSLGSVERPLIGLFGRIAAWKGQKVFVEALSKLPDVHGVMIGDALFADADQQYKRELLALVEKLGITNRAHFAGFQNDVLPYLKTVDVVVHCSTSPEPFGRVIVEAQLAGKPVIATRGGGPSEIIEDRVTGILVTPNDPNELALVILELLEKPKLAEELATNGRQAAVQRFGLESVLEQWTAFIDAACSERRGGRAQETTANGSDFATVEPTTPQNRRFVGQATNGRE